MASSHPTTEQGFQAICTSPCLFVLYVTTVTYPALPRFPAPPHFSVRSHVRSALHSDCNLSGRILHLQFELCGALMASNHPNRSAPAAAAAATSTTPLLEAVSSRSRSPSPRPRAFSPNLRRSSSSEPLLGEYVRRRRRSPRRYVHPALITVVLVALIALVTWDVSPIGRCYLRPLCRALNRKDPMAEVYWRNAGPYAPWKSLGAGGGPKGLPRGCKLDQVNLVRKLGAPNLR